MNKVIIIGRLTRDPELRYAANETAVLRCTVAVDRRFKRDGEQSADFISTVAFNKTAEFIEKYFSKGSKIVIIGRIQTGSFDGADGKKVYTTDVVVEEVEFAESKRTDGQGGYVTPAAESTAGDGYFPIDMMADDGNIPF